MTGIVFAQNNVCSLHPDNRHPWGKLSKDLKTRLALISWLARRQCARSQRADVLCRSSTDLPSTVSRATFSRHVQHTSLAIFPHKMFVVSHRSHRFVNGNLQPVLKCHCSTCTADVKCCRMGGSGDLLRCRLLKSGSRSSIKEEWDEVGVTHTRTQTHSCCWTILIAGGLWKSESCRSDLKAALKESRAALHQFNHAVTRRALKTSQGATVSVDGESLSSSRLLRAGHRARQRHWVGWKESLPAANWSRPPNSSRSTAWSPDEWYCLSFLN